ncbi:cobalamin transport operon protein [Halobellus sp. H-GB7]|uniref:cobalamin transport operon protein n=1 Tax=Halobellus sp. H-GB7 TaxID=3069756 RepID=UPI0027AF6038|nr:cobalamin transport operon protein [Halobellus sp. H-GB7]MDQ2055011.1 cobalamin transport operon protein [Halobellus sp. H-GB7]
MKRWTQYGSLLGLLTVFFAAGLWGFAATGGAVPWAKRSATTLQRGIQEGGGALVDLGRGVVVAGPIRNGGLVVEFLAVAALFALVGVGLYVYADRYRGLDDAKRTGR